jgi:hypothetical protein
MIRAPETLNYPKDDRPTSFVGHDFVPIVFGAIEVACQQVDNTPAGSQFRTSKIVENKALGNRTAESLQNIGTLFPRKRGVAVLGRRLGCLAIAVGT